MEVISNLHVYAQIHGILSYRKNETVESQRRASATSLQQLSAASDEGRQDVLTATIPVRKTPSKVPALRMLSMVAAGCQHLGGLSGRRRSRCRACPEHRPLWLVS